MVRGFHDAERHLRDGAVLAREIGRPYLEVGCLAQLGFASNILPFAAIQRACREAIALAERHGWGNEPIVAPALIALAGTMVWTGEFDEAERWLQRTARALQTDIGPGYQAPSAPSRTACCRPPAAATMRHCEEFSAAEYLGSQLAGSHALASRVTGWMVATEARLGMPAEARAFLAALDDGAPARVRS